MAYESIIEKEETSRCFLCLNGPCEKSCPNGVRAAEIIRSLRFNDEARARKLIPNNNPCKTCMTKECEKNCNRLKLGNPVRICEVISELTSAENNAEDVDLSIDFVECTVRILSFYLHQ